MPGVLTTVYLRVTSIEPTNEYDDTEVVCNIYHRNQLVAEVIADELDVTFKIPLKTEFEKISFELKSLLDDERILGTASFSYDFIKLAEPNKEYFQKIYLSPLGDNFIGVRDWGRDTEDHPCIEIGLEVDSLQGRDQAASTTSKNFSTHYRVETSYIGKSHRLADDYRYMSTIHPIETKTALVRDKGFLSPTRKLYDTGIRVDGTQQTIIRKEGKQVRSTRHGSVGRDMLGEGLEIRGTRPSKFAKVRSAKSIKVSRDTPQHREQLKVVLKRLIATLDHKNDDLVKDTENRLKILDWLFKNKAQYDNAFSGGGSDIASQQTLVSEVDREYAEVYKLDQDDLYSLRADVDRMREELEQAERDLIFARETRERLLKFFGKAESDDLEILEEEIIEDETGRMTSKRLINRYVRRTDREVQEVRDENHKIYRQLEGLKNEINSKIGGAQSKGIGTTLEELFRGVNMKLNGVTGSKEVQNETLKNLNEEYIDMVDKNLDLKKRKVETENEVSTLREFVNNDRELKTRLEAASLRGRAAPGVSSANQKAEIQKKITALNKEKMDLERQLKANLERMRTIEERLGDSGRTNELDRMIKRLENSLKQRNDLQDNLIRNVSSNVHTIDVKTEVVGAGLGSHKDDRRVQDLLDEIERKDKEINALLDLKEECDRKRRVQKRKNELMYNLTRDISELEKKAKEAEADCDKMKIDVKNNRNIDVELANKETKIADQEQLIEKLDIELDRLEQRAELGPGVEGIEDEDEERAIENLRAKLNDCNKRIEAARRNTDFKKLEQKKRILQEKEEYILELQRQLD